MYSQSKTPASMFSFDYKHMSVAPSLASGCGGEYVLRAWSQFSGNYFELSGLKFRFQLKINFPRKKACEVIKNLIWLRDADKRVLIDSYE